MLAAKGTNDSLHKNAWIQSSKHALTEECCPQLLRMAAQQSGCTATPFSAYPARVGVRAPAGGGQALPKSWGGHVVGVAFVAVGTKMALTVTGGKA